MTHPTISQKAVEAAAEAMRQRRRDVIEGRAEHPTFEEQAEAALTAALAVDGLVLVPREPTEEMLDAGACYEFQDRHIVDDGDISRDVYRAMLSAAPTGTEG